MKTSVESEGGVQFFVCLENSTFVPVNADACECKIILLIFLLQDTLRKQKDENHLKMQFESNL